MKKRFSIIGIVFIFSLIMFIIGCPTAPAEKDDDDSNTEVVLDSIYISKKPTKTNYEYNAILDLAGLEVKARYSDKTAKVITDWTSNPKNGTKLTTSGTVNIVVTYQTKTATFRINVSEKPIISTDQYFWGTWVRMDNGKEYEVLESSVVFDDSYYSVTNSTEDTLLVNGLGLFTKKSEVVIENNNIPYFRKGGINLDYSIKLVGFTQKERIAGSKIGMSGIKGKGIPSKHTKYISEGESDTEGIITFTAPTIKDTQTVIIDYDGEIVVVTGLNIENTDDYMGTIALVEKNDYNLKITGAISDDQKDNGYLFGNNAKTYDMTLTITNISDNECSVSGCIIEPDAPNLLLESDTNLNGFTISTLPSGATKEIKLNISYGELNDPYVDTGINITLKNPFTKQEWKDYVPLRFYKGTIPITIAAKSTENNKEAALNGIIIYPDGNNQFFAIPHDTCKSIFVPTFGKEKTYKLVLCGATVTSKLSESTEMYYTVEPASINARPVITEDNIDVLLEYMTFGGDNHSEYNSYSVTEGFEAYLRKGEIDYWTIIADNDGYYGITPKQFTSEVIYLPVGTDGSAGTKAQYVLFGDYPQKRVNEDIKIYEDIREEHGRCTYYYGSDGYWYKKDLAGVFRVEPIKWRILTYNYNNTGNALLLSENILGTSVYYDYNVTRKFMDQTVYANNYKESAIRAHLNGLYYYVSMSGHVMYPLIPELGTVIGNGFLQTAFTIDAQNRIATTSLGSGMNDKIFLLSEKEVTKYEYGFSSYNSGSENNARIKNGNWWLRSPYSDGNNTSKAYCVGEDGALKDSIITAYNGIVPAITISLKQD